MSELHIHVHVHLHTQPTESNETGTKDMNQSQSNKETARVDRVQSAVTSATGLVTGAGNFLGALTSFVGKLWG